MKILFIGDIVGSGGRMAVKEIVPKLQEEFSCDFCVANGENMAAGNGYSRSCIRELADCGVDVFTSGDHIWDQKEWPGAIVDYPNVLRPANLPSVQPGKGAGTFRTKNGLMVGVLNLLGRTFVATQSDSPFEAAETLVEELRKETPFILVDFHAEATSEKIALGRLLDGRATAVIGTHTHVPTADEQIFPGGTAFQCDAGMVGARESVLGREIKPVLTKFRTGMPVRFPVVETGIRLCATLITADENGRATAIQRIVRDASF